MQCCNVIDAVSTVSHCVAQPLQRQLGSAGGGRLGGGGQGGGQGGGARRGQGGQGNEGRLQTGCGPGPRSIRFLKVLWRRVVRLQGLKCLADCSPVMSFVGGVRIVGQGGGKGEGKGEVDDREGMGGEGR